MKVLILVISLYNAGEATFVGLNVLDYALTIKALNEGAIEMNPIAKNMNPYTMAIYKAGTTSGFLLLNRSIKKENERAAKILLISANLFYSAIVTNNITVILRL